MENTQKQLASWDEVQIKPATEYVKFKKPDVKTGIPVEEVFVIKNWEIFWADEKDFNDNSKIVKKIKFKCDVVAIGQKIVNNTKISNSSSRFITAIKPWLQNKSPNVAVFLSIMKIGNGKDTNFVIKEVQATELYQ